MDIDRRLFEEFLQDPKALPILRVFRAKAAAITVGRSWRKKRLPEGAVLRPTGGGLVRHGNDFIYTVIARKDTFPTFGMVRTSYLSLHEAVLAALEKRAILARLYRCDEPRTHQATFGECFLEPVATDVLLNRQKIAGGAQWRRAGVFLHQGSILLLKGMSFDVFKRTFLIAFEEQFGCIWDKLPAVV